MGSGRSPLVRVVKPSSTPTMVQQIVKSSSGRVRSSGTKTAVNTGIRMQWSEVLNPKAMRRAKAVGNAAERQRQTRLTPAEKKMYQEATDTLEHHHIDADEDGWEDIMTGAQPFDISHAGNEFEDLVEEMQADVYPAPK
ncbi:hypothetical protein FA95DRAFT_1601331 [Auriscalpium vulgare]|uniref:Uncharacterized protein n=1 Tax=Auriscalpium vulgare TaxID=40419 RepID=A0ACB8S8N6_9AGAM|nr:hypothetical protein FA95DRAFT_1601331 [Auriscalpium vulgare]